jgi:hypothetical protein
LVKENSGALAVSRNGDLDAVHACSANVPQRGGGAVAQNRTASRSEYGSYEVTNAAEAAMAHGVHASMQGVRAAAGEMMPDRPGADTDLEQLAARDHAVLALGNRGDRSIRPTLTAFGPIRA